MNIKVFTALIPKCKKNWKKGDSFMSADINRTLTEQLSVLAVDLIMDVLTNGQTSLLKCFCISEGRWHLNTFTNKTA